MKATVIKSSLAAALKSLRRTAALKPYVKVSIDGERLVLCTMASEKCHYSTSVAACVDDSQDCAFVGLNQLTRIVTMLPDGMIHVERFGDGGLQLKSADTEYCISPALNVVEFSLPDVKPIEEAKTFGLSVPTFHEILRKVKYAASDDLSRHSLCGVMFTVVEGILTAVATDGRRLATVDYDLNEKALTTSLFLPNEVVGKLFEIARVKSWRDYGETVKFAVWGKSATVEVESRCFSVMLAINPDLRFPVWRQCIPVSANRCVVFPRDRMLEAVSRCASWFAWSHGRGVVFDFTGQGCKLTYEADGIMVRESLSCRLESEPFSVMFDPRYVADICKAYDDDMITVTTKAADDNRVNAPCKFETSIPSIAVLMTMRIS